MLILLSFLFQGIISLRIKGKTVTGHDNLEQTANVNADLVFIGSSRCLAHFDPAFFDSTFKLKSINIGVIGHSEISMAIIRLEDYLSRNKPPSSVIFSFDPFCSPNTFSNNSNFIIKNDFSRYAFFPSKMDLPIVNYFRFNFCEKYVPMYALFKYHLLADAITLTNVDNSAILGYQMEVAKWDTITNPVTDFQKRNFFKISDVSAITNSLDSLKKLCGHYNIKLLCIQTPVYKIIYNDSIFSETNKICNNINIPMIDLNEEHIRNNITYFSNSNHLNKSGVDEMNTLLKKDSLLTSFLQNTNRE